MKKIFSEPFFWLTLIAVLNFLIFLFRGLKTMRWKTFARLFISLSCLLAALILSPYVTSARPIQSIAAIMVIAAAVAVAIDIFLGIFFAVKSSILTGRDFTAPLPDYLMEICKAMEILANRRMGALIVIRRNDKLDEYVGSGMLFDSQIKSEILVALFSRTSPVHDGAVVVSNGRIRRVKTILSLKTDGEVPMGIGTRHRSALGITEKTDAIALVVSEERGEISVAYRGTLVKIMSQGHLYSLLAEALKGKTISPIQ